MSLEWIKSKNRKNNNNNSNDPPTLPNNKAEESRIIIRAIEFSNIDDLTDLLDSFAQKEADFTNLPPIYVEKGVVKKHELYEDFFVVEETNYLKLMPRHIILLDDNKRVSELRIVFSSYYYSPYENLDRESAFSISVTRRIFTQFMKIIT